MDERQIITDELLTWGVGNAVYFSDENIPPIENLNFHRIKSSVIEKKEVFKALKTLEVKGIETYLI